MMSKPSSTMVILRVILYNEVTQYKHCLAPATQLGDKMVKLKKKNAVKASDSTLSLQNILAQYQQKDN